MFVNVCRRGDGDNRPLFKFASMPKPTTKYVCPPRVPKEKKSNLKFYNIMGDPRVRRGSYAFDLGPKIPELPYYPCFDMVRKDPLCRLYIRTLKKCVPIDDKNGDLISTGTRCTPLKPKAVGKSPVKPKTSPDDESNLVGKITKESQTETYYEILADQPPLVPNCTQTDVVSDLSYELLGHPPTFVPAVEVGKDMETQIIPGELFYFDEEIANVVNNCVSAVVEQGLMELMMENELDALMAQQRAYEGKRNLELLRLQRLQQRQQDLVEANKRLIQRDREAMEKAREAGENISNAMFAKHYLNDLQDTTMGAARKDGALEENYDADPFMKWIRIKTKKLHRVDVTSRDLLDDLLRTTATGIGANFNPLAEYPEEETKKYDEEIGEYEFLNPPNYAEFQQEQEYGSWGPDIAE